MGLALNVAVLLRDWLKTERAPGPVATLGVVDTDFDQRLFFDAIGRPDGRPTPMSADQFFADCGASPLISIDVDAYEGAMFRFDLNEEVLPTELSDRFGIVFNAGTLEHVFHIPNALSNITRMLKPGGIALHILPANNSMDHGFYQFGPTLALDYYSAAKFDILNSVSVHFTPSSTKWLVRPSRHGSVGEGILGAMDDRVVFHLFMARKAPSSLDRAIPMQSLYRRVFSVEFPPALDLPWFLPFELENGKRLPNRDPREFHVKSATDNGGLMWGAALPDAAPDGDSDSLPIRSDLALFEDGRLLGPPHSLHDTIRSTGRGAYSHWGRAVFFSTSDGTDPNTNGRSYICKF